MSYSPAEITTILDEMQKLFGDYPVTELNYETPFQCLLAVMLSAQTTDIQVNKVTDVLYTKIKKPADLVEMGMDEFGQAIRTVGLWKSKMKNWYRLAEMLLYYDIQDSFSFVPHDPVYSKNKYKVPEDCAYIDSNHVYNVHGY